MCFATLFSVFAQTLMQKLTPGHLLGKVAEFSFLVVFVSGLITMALALLSRQLPEKAPE